MGKLLLLFIGVPVVELILLVEVGRRVGTLPTLALIVVTGTVGAALARRQGLAVLNRIRTEMGGGSLPGAALVDGVIVLVAGALLLTPGILTDVVGFSCLVPAVRGWIRKVLRRRFERALKDGEVSVFSGGAWQRRGGGGGAGSPIDVEWERVETESGKGPEESASEILLPEGRDTKSP